MKMHTGSGNNGIINRIFSKIPAKISKGVLLPDTRLY